MREGRIRSHLIVRERRNRSSGRQVAQEQKHGTKSTIRSIGGRREMRESERKRKVVVAMMEKAMNGIPGIKRTGLTSRKILLLIWTTNRQLFRHLHWCLEIDGPPTMSSPLQRIRVQNTHNGTPKKTYLDLYVHSESLPCQIAMKKT